MTNTWGGARSWPAAAISLFDELAAKPGRICLLTGEGNATFTVASALADAGEASLTRFGAWFTEGTEGPKIPETWQPERERAILLDLDVLFWPALTVDPVALLRLYSKRHPIVAVWPGDIPEGVARYSEPGRPDHFSRKLEDALILRARSTAYPDEVPYEIERVA
jgi:hypothetical protein